MSYYYSLKTEHREYCIEPLIFGGAYSAEYNLNQILLTKKKLLKDNTAIRNEMKIIEEKTGKKFKAKSI